MIFFVKDSRNRILYPSIKDRWAEKLVKRGRAKWIRRRVIILQLGYEVREAPRDKISYFSIGNDTGYGNIGLSLVKITGNRVLKILSGTGTLRTAVLRHLPARCRGTGNPDVPECSRSVFPD